MFHLWPMKCLSVLICLVMFAVGFFRASKLIRKARGFLSLTFPSVFQHWRHLSVEKNRMLFVKLYPEISSLSRDKPPIASFIIRVISSAGGRKSLAHPGNSSIHAQSWKCLLWNKSLDALTGKFHDIARPRYFFAAWSIARFQAFPSARLSPF